MPIELALLSRVRCRGQEITGPRLRGLFALLAGDLRTGCSTARLVEGLWPDEQPENPTKALQVLVSRARAQLGSDIIARTPTGYRLALAEEQVDASAVLLRASASRPARPGRRPRGGARARRGRARAVGRAGELGRRAATTRCRRCGRSGPSTYRIAGAGPRARAGAAGPPRRGGRAAHRARRASTRATRRCCVELLRCEAATAGPAAALARYDAYRRDAARRARRRSRRRAAARAPASCCRRRSPRSGAASRTSPTRCSAGTTTSPRSRACCAPPGSRRSSGRRSRQDPARARAWAAGAEQRVVHFVELAGVAARRRRRRRGRVGARRRRVRAGPGRPVRCRPDSLAGIASALGPGPALLVLDNCEHVVARRRRPGARRWWR